MNLLKSLSKSQVTAILGIILLITTSLWVWDRYENEIELSEQDAKYNKLYEENQLLNYEIKNLQEQNQLLYKVLELKQNLE